MGLNLNINFGFLRLESRELLSFQFGPSSFTWNSEYNFVQMEGLKNGCLTFFIGFVAKKLDIYLDNSWK